MDTTAAFIRSITINKVRHLSDIKIEIDQNRPRHLILTGANGCGKTSVLKAVKSYLEGIPNQELARLNSYKDAIKELRNRQQNLDEQLRSPEHTILKGERERLAIERLKAERDAQGLESIVAKYNELTVDVSNLGEAIRRYALGEFLVAAFEAKRAAKISVVEGAKKLDLPKVSPIDVDGKSVGSKFLQFLVNQENRAALLARKGDQAGEAVIVDWMKRLTERFRDLFGNEQLVLDYDIDNFDFKIKMPGREPFRLVDNQLSDGFSAVIQIVVELLLRMEAVSPGRYDVPGIVLIDEVETHLHIELQKAILPFLTGFFPNIQFIVTTHSPFVLTSLPDSVVFDLESKKRWEHLAPLSASTVIEDYFDSDLYSAESKRMIDRYTALAKIASRTSDEEAELEELRCQLDLLEFDHAPELVAHYRKLRAKEKAA